MIAIGGDYTVLLGNRRFHSDGDGFLAVVQVAESADKLGFIERIGGDFHPAHQSHVAEEGEQFLRSGLNGAGWRVRVVAGEGEIGLDSNRRCGEVARGGKSGGDGLEESGGTASNLSH